MLFGRAQHAYFVHVLRLLFIIPARVKLYVRCPINVYAQYPDFFHDLFSARFTLYITHRVRKVNTWRTSEKRRYFTHAK